MFKKVAILYQAVKVPEIDGISKPLKPGGYSDSGADIAYSLIQNKIPVVLPVNTPDVNKDKDWVFPDTEEGIEEAINKGAQILWLNTVLYKGHPVEKFIEKGIFVVGQVPERVEIYDDKWFTNHKLQSNHIPVPASVWVDENNKHNYNIDFPFPVIGKPVRGRGSQGVTKIDNKEELTQLVQERLGSKEFGNALYIEEYLPGEELTLTIMPPGKYRIKNKEYSMVAYWSLPVVRRFNHQDGIAPYSGKVAVTKNSEVLSETAQNSPNIKHLCKQCEAAAALVGALAPIRIDCRANAKGEYFLFDVNLKPNMTGSGRPHREDQDSLSALAARGIGWTYSDLLINILYQYWGKEKLKLH